MFFVLKLSKLCNLRCTYCYEYDDLGRPERMALEDLERFFAWLAAKQPDAGWPFLQFVFHGGEPLLLPLAYLEGLVTAQRRHLDPAGIRYVNSLQTNLTRIDDAAIALLDRLRIGLGVSLDVFGDQRVMLSGDDSQDRVLKNLQKLFDSGSIRRLGVGIIAVLHRLNIDRVLGIYEFCSELGLTLRVLPVFALQEPPLRMAGLTVSHQEIVRALQRLGTHWLACGLPIEVFPLRNYFDAAVNSLLGVHTRTYDPRAGDWAYIINTNGDTYSNAEAYSPAGWMGNIFKQPLLDMIGSDAHAKSLEPRLRRARVCEACTFCSACTRVPLIESLPSERAFGADGGLQCPIALPMIEFFRQQLLADTDAAALISRSRPEAAQTLASV
jgi:uncharacterized protein